MVFAKLPLMAKVKKKSLSKLITKINDVPVTHLELNGLKRQISSMNLSINKKLDSVDQRFQSIDQRFESLESKMDSRFTFMNSRFDQLHADIHKVLVTVEEQNARNKAVMDSQALIQYKFEEHDARIFSLEQKVHGIK
jgi:hypothetical protein